MATWFVCGTVNDSSSGRRLDRYRWPRRRPGPMDSWWRLQMVFPDFWHCPPLVRGREIMLAGDHMQLSPITPRLGAQTRERW